MKASLGQTMIPVTALPVFAIAAARFASESGDASRCHPRMPLPADWLPDVKRLQFF
jgi:hypothetical protein